MLARREHRLTLLEKAHHPRFHIGESLLPANLQLLESLGVAGDIKAIGMETRESNLSRPGCEHVQQFQFADALINEMPMSCQVRRSEFDEILLRKLVEAHLPVVPGSVGAIRALSKRYPLALVSGSHRAEIQWALGKLGIGLEFDAERIHDRA